MLFVYAFSSRTYGDLGSGISGEPLSTSIHGAIEAIVSEVEETPKVDTTNAVAFDRLMNRLLEHSAALLPARFGMTARDRGALEKQVGEARDALERSLALVADRRQLTLRLFGSTSANARGSAAPSRPASGSDYLARKLEEHRRARKLPELDAIKPWLDPLIVAERIERSDAQPWFASAYHLVDARRISSYRAALEALLPRLEPSGVRVKLSGPFAPYAFAPGVFE